MAIEISAFRWVPPFAQGYVRDLRVRWALEEAGLAYRAILLGAPGTREGAYRCWQPFGQVPAYRDEEVEIFESGAIVLHVAAKPEAGASLMPADAAGRATVAAWVIAALNSVEPFVQNVVHLDVFHAGQGWTEDARPQAVAALEGRLGALAARLGDADYLCARFTAADLMMACVLRELVEGGILSRFPSLDAHRARCEARPAFARALAAQLAPFREHAPG